MRRPASQLRRDALQIWQAGVEAVRSDRLVRQALRVEGGTITIGWDKQSEVPPAEAAQTQRWDRASPGPPYSCHLLLDQIRRIVVVGAGKAGAGMAEAVEAALGPRLMAEKQLTGWVNVPADCVRPLQQIHLHAARPAGLNEPTPEGVAGAGEILRLVESLAPDDLCLCLISGGGSALMPAPVEGVSLADKLAVTRHLSAAGANIEQLNTGRKQLSRLKGGGLLRACRAGRLVSLIISDVLGDPFDVIASGPTVPDSSTPQAALDVLQRFDARGAGISPAVFAYLERAAHAQRNPFSRVHAAQPPDVSAGAERDVANFIIGNNATAVAAAGQEAQRLGYAVDSESATQSEGPAEEVGRRLAHHAFEMRAGGGPRCLVSGGEPVVKLVDAPRRGLGGRNQQLVLAALIELERSAWQCNGRACPPCLTADTAGKPARCTDAALAPALGIVILSGGTDGEDGPTDAAGALVDDDTLTTVRNNQLDPADCLARNDAYHFFGPLGALIKTGPTHTNVCDVRVVVTDI